MDNQTQERRPEVLRPRSSDGGRRFIAGVHAIAPLQLGRSSKQGDYKWSLLDYHCHRLTRQWLPTRSVSLRMHGTVRPDLPIKGTDRKFRWL